MQRYEIFTTYAIFKANKCTRTHHNAPYFPQRTTVHQRPLKMS